MLLDVITFPPLLAIFLCATVVNICDSEEYENAFCLQKSCPYDGYFRCKVTGKCVSPTARCNGNDDCGDGSDEENCLYQRYTCNHGRGYYCDNGTRCIIFGWLCDVIVDCVDRSDETNCLYKPCPYAGDFKCNDTGTCIRSHSICNGVADCRNGTDELNCASRPCPYDSDHRCGDGICIRSTSVCNRYNNCRDGSDEVNCTYKCPYEGDVDCRGSCYRSYQFCNLYQRCTDNMSPNCSTIPCPYEGDFRCPSTGICVRSYQVCDGLRHCSGGEDEQQCSSLNCQSRNLWWCLGNGNCVNSYSACISSSCGYNHDSSTCSICTNSTRLNSYVLYCNGINDCADGSDERNCYDRQCPATDDFRCSTTGSCIRKYQVCDGKLHCSDGSDEQNCLMRNCSISGDVKCIDNGTCIHYEMVCDGVRHCLDGSDELNCASRPCPYSGDRRCATTQVCIRADKWCNGNKDCEDGSDEECYDTPCPYNGDFRCVSNGYCIRQTQVCNGNVDCSDGSDEGMNYCKEETTMGLVWERSLTRTVYKYKCSDIHPSFKIADMVTRECTRNRRWGLVDMSQCVMDVDSPVVMILAVTFDTENATLVQANIRQITEEIREKIIGTSSTQFEIIGNSGNISVKITYEFTSITINQLVDIISYGVLTNIGNITISSGPQLTIFNSTDACKCPTSVEKSTVPIGVNNTGELEIFSVCTGKPCQCSTGNNCECVAPFVGNGVVCGRDSDGDGYADMKLNCDGPECEQDTCIMVYNPDQINSPCAIDATVATGSSADESLSTGAAIAITFVLTLLLSVALTLLVVYIVYKINTRKEQTISEAEVPSSAKPIVTAKDSDVYEFPENVQSPRYQGDPLATIQPNPSYDMHYFDTKKDKPVYANIK